MKTEISKHFDERMRVIEQPLGLPSGAVLKNRVVKSAMSEALGDAWNNPTDGLIRLYERWSKGGAALLITGNTPVDRQHLEHAANIVLDPRSDRTKIRSLAAAAKSGGALALVQISHSGRQTPSTVNPQPLSISDCALQLSGYGRPRTASEADLLAVIEQFARSAALAQEAGFDGVEIHAAHGYLLSSSLSPRINTRSDRWGGTLENRTRLLRSIVNAVRAATGRDFVVAVKLNSSDFQKGGFDHAESVAVARLLQDEGIDFLEVSGGNFESPVAYRHDEGQKSTMLREAYFLDYARDVKAVLEIPVMVTGGFRSLEVMERALTEEASDLIGIGRPFIIDPEFPARLFAGEIDKIPAPERAFPPARDLPKGAVLNWFCHQLWLHGREGRPVPDLPILEGHARYLASLQQAVEHRMAAIGTG